jgi:hypothetical protein
MKSLIGKRLATGIVALGVAGGSLYVSPATASASSRQYPGTGGIKDG